MNVFSYKKLSVWQKSIELAKETYLLLQKLPKMEEFVLKDQMRRAVISVNSNIAEGSARKSPSDQAKFYIIARSSLVELDSQLEVCKVLGYINEKTQDLITPILHEIYKMLSGLLTSLESKRN